MHAARSEPEDPEQVWFGPELELDEGALNERVHGPETLDPLAVDQEVRLLARANRLALVRGTVERHPAVQQGTDALDVPFRCVAHPAPDCRFRWVRIVLNLAPTAGTVISDLVPRNEVADQPVNITTTYRGGLSFHIAAIAVSPELSAERSTQRDVYFPSVTSSGIGLTHAIWDFTAVANAPLRVDRDLRLLAALPSTTDRIDVQVTLRASVVADGLLGALPLIGRHQATVRLDGPLRTGTP